MSNLFCINTDFTVTENKIMTESSTCAFHSELSSLLAVLNQHFFPDECWHKSAECSSNSQSEDSFQRHLSENVATFRGDMFAAKQKYIGRLLDALCKGGLDILRSFGQQQQLDFWRKYELNALSMVYKYVAVHKIPQIFGSDAATVQKHKDIHLATYTFLCPGATTMPHKKCPAVLVNYYKRRCNDVKNYLRELKELTSSIFTNNHTEILIQSFHSNSECELIPLCNDQFIRQKRRDIAQQAMLDLNISKSTNRKFLHDTISEFSASATSSSSKDSKQTMHWNKNNTSNTSTQPLKQSNSMHLRRNKPPFQKLPLSNEAPSFKRGM